MRKSSPRKKKEHVPDGTTEPIPKQIPKQSATKTKSTTKKQAPQTKKAVESPETVPEPKQGQAWGWLSRKQKDDSGKDMHASESELDVILESLTTPHCKESMRKEELKDVFLRPEYYLKVNMVRGSRMIDTFFIPSGTATFGYGKKSYQVREQDIFLLPHRGEQFIPTAFFREGEGKPKSFLMENKGITGKALTLLYTKQLYRNLIYEDDLKYNFFIVILQIVGLVLYGIGLYLLFFHNGNGDVTVTQPVVPAMVRGWWFW